MARSHRETYKRRNRAARESKRHPGRFCPRCGLRLTPRNPLIEENHHCALCEHELAAGRVAVGLYAN